MDVRGIHLAPVKRDLPVAARMNDIPVGDWIVPNGLLEQAMEQQPPRARGAPIEAEGELLERVIELGRLNRPMMSTEQPALQERGDSGDDRKAGDPLSAEVYGGALLHVPLPLKESVRP